MYLKQAFIENSGSIRSLNLKLEFTAEGLPKPLILVGGNGGGKTNFLSTVADALFEAAAVHYSNVLPLRSDGHLFFRLLGGMTVTIGAPGSFTLLRFDEGGVPLFFTEKVGKIDPKDVRSRVPAEFSDQINWQFDDAVKVFGISGERSKAVFNDGIYVYFPSSRSEIPYWLNVESTNNISFDTSTFIAKTLRKPLYVEHALTSFKQWLIGVLADARVNLRFDEVEPNVAKWSPSPEDDFSRLMSSRLLASCNTILQYILCEKDARFHWLGRNAPEKVCIVNGRDKILPTLDSLSSGQALLLGIFGTIIKYGDLSSMAPQLELSLIKGICLIDEVDAHTHIELQQNVLPNLIKLFPRVQFILTTHSPLFVLGMEQAFGADRIQIVEMPNGTLVSAENYAEFGQAMNALVATKAFNDRVISEAKKAGTPIVYLEGETDPLYIKRAAFLFSRIDLLERCHIEWIGAKSDGGQGFNTGKDALKHTLSLLKANPTLSNRHILLFYDNDTNSPDQDYPNISVRTIPKNNNNMKVKAGIENLLTEDCFEDSFYDTKEICKPNGTITVTKQLRKSDLCDAVCATGTVEQFSAFNEALDIIEAFLNKIAPVSLNPHPNGTK